MTLPTISQLYNDPTRKLKFVGTLLCLDPGETTGVAVFSCKENDIPILSEALQLATKDVDEAAENLTELFKRVRPDHIVCEDYRVYKWKQEEHTNSNLMTTQVIGMIKYLCVGLKVLPTMQMASQAKGFVDDDKLKAWDFWIKGKRHARDAIRHGVYYMLFSHQSKKERERQDAYRNKNSSKG